MTIPQWIMKHPFQALLVLAGFMVFLFLPVVFVSLLLLGALIPSIRHKIFGNEEDNLASTTKRTKPSSTLYPNSRRMDTAEYHSYLQSPEWKSKVSLIKQRDKVCQLTGATTQLEVHHITYDRLGNEDLSDLVLLSRSAHQFVHDYYGSYRRSNTYPIDNLKEII